jgi:hypothetical protein
MSSFAQFFEEKMAKDTVEKFAEKFKVCPKQLAMGVEVEKEHDGPMGKDTDVVKKVEDIVKIAVAHLREDPSYYTKLKKVEKS